MENEHKKFQKYHYDEIDIDKAAEEEAKEEGKTKHPKWTKAKGEKLGKVSDELLEKKKHKEHLPRLDFPRKDKQHTGKQYLGGKVGYIDEVMVRGARRGPGGYERPLEELTNQELLKTDRASEIRTVYIKKHWSELSYEMKKVLTPDQWRVEWTCKKEEAKGLKQKDAAERLRKSPSYVSKVKKESEKKLREAEGVQKVCKKIMSEICDGTGFRRMKG